MAQKNTGKSSVALALLLLLSFNLYVALAARSIPAEAKSKKNNVPTSAMKSGKNFESSAGDKKLGKDCLLDHEGTVLIPGIGRHMIGDHNIFPSISGLDHSVPAAVNGHYLPGGDDTFVPNPGFEVPNPFNAGAGIP